MPAVRPACLDWSLGQVAAFADLRTPLSYGRVNLYAYKGGEFSGDSLDQQGRER